MLGLLCIFKEHKFKHIMNFNDVMDGRGLYQCSRCKKIDVDMASAYHDRARKRGLRTRINWNYKPYNQLKESE